MRKPLILGLDESRVAKDTQGCRDVGNHRLPSAYSDSNAGLKRKTEQNTANDSPKPHRQENNRQGHSEVGLDGDDTEHQARGERPGLGQRPPSRDEAEQRPYGALADRLMSHERWKQQARHEDVPTRNGHAASGGDRDQTTVHHR